MLKKPFKFHVYGILLLFTAFQMHTLFKIINAYRSHLSSYFVPGQILTHQMDMKFLSMSSNIN